MECLLNYRYNSQILIIYWLVFLHIRIYNIYILIKKYLFIIKDFIMPWEKE